MKRAEQFNSKKLNNKKKERINLLNSTIAFIASMFVAGMPIAYANQSNIIFPESVTAVNSSVKTDPEKLDSENLSELKLKTAPPFSIDFSQNLPSAK